MSRKVKLGLGITLALIIVLVVTNPGAGGDAKYMSWLEKEHGIFCTYDPFQLVSCVQAEEELDWRSRAVKNTGLYTIYKDHYRKQDGKFVNIHAFGMLNMYFNR
ncbi:hypothetical protein [Paenibacillus paeoniae]|uniref:hypothetical protein n=1 Tax=Paenibacillus paeoniae TaxID=2292705 RepID=UPI001058A5A2|nr:hypothetical protein [Paenibacillus paeoniae]